MKAVPDSKGTQQVHPDPWKQFAEVLTNPGGSRDNARKTLAARGMHKTS